MLIVLPLSQRSLGPFISVCSCATNIGWAVNPNGTDTATLGRWERGDPEATDYQGSKQLGSTTSGLNDLVTGRLAGAGPGDYDLDGGTTSIRSPAITLPASGNLMLSLRYYLAYTTNASSADFFRVRIVGSSGTTTVFERLGAARDVDATWQTASISLNGYAGQSSTSRSKPPTLPPAACSKPPSTMSASPPINAASSGRS